VKMQMARLLPYPKNEHEWSLTNVLSYTFDNQKGLWSYSATVNVFVGMIFIEAIATLIAAFIQSVSTEHQ
jgi:hypothetical protein